MIGRPTPLPKERPIVEPNGTPRMEFQNGWQLILEHLNSLTEEVDGKQDADATLTALAGLDATAGLVEQTGADAFTKRAMGVAASTSVLTRGDGDGRYALTAHVHAIADVTGLQTALDGKQPLDATLTALAGATWSAGSQVLTLSAADTVTLVTVGAASGNILNKAAGDSLYQPLDSTLTAFAAYNTNGILTQTAADTFAGRTITGTANEITVADGNGVSGNPTISLPTAITGTGKTWTGGTFSGLSTASVVNSQDGGTTIRIDNANTGTAASAVLDCRNGALGTSDRLFVGVLGTGFTAITGWQDAGVMAVQGNIAGGLILCAVASAGIKFEVGGNGSTNQIANINTTGVNVASGKTYSVNGTQVVSARGAAVADAAGGATIDAEARTALNALLARLRTHGLIAT